MAAARTPLYVYFLCNDTHVPVKRNGRESFALFGLIRDVDEVNSSCGTFKAPILVPFATRVFNIALSFLDEFIENGKFTRRDRDASYRTTDADTRAGAEGVYGFLLAALNPFCGVPIPDQCAASKSLELAQYLHKKGALGGICRSAASHNSIEILKWAYTKGHPIGSHTYTCAAANGHIGAMQWMFANTNARPDEYTSARAAENNHLATLQWLHANAVRAADGSFENLWDEHVCAMAALGGHFAVLQWLRANGCPWNDQTCTSAAFANHPDILQWAHAGGCPLSSGTANAAASCGNVAMLQWLRERGCPLTADTCMSAAQNGHINALQWLRAIGVAWTSAVLREAAGGGHNAVVQWAHENGCPWDDWVYMRAILAKSLGIIQYLHAHGHPLRAHDAAFARQHNKHEVAAWIEDHTS
jgi:hypothetical protein